MVHLRPLPFTWCNKKQHILNTSQTPTLYLTTAFRNHKRKAKSVWTINPARLGREKKSYYMLILLSLSHSSGDADDANHHQRNRQKERKNERNMHKLFTWVFIMWFNLTVLCFTKEICASLLPLTFLTLRQWVSEAEGMQLDNRSKRGKRGGGNFDLDPVHLNWQSARFARSPSIRQSVPIKPLPRVVSSLSLSLSPFRSPSGRAFSAHLTGMPVTESTFSFVPFALPHPSSLIP